ncbi:MAG: FkbM family methyltransferase [Rhodomicrobium sp.]
MAEKTALNQILRSVKNYTYPNRVAAQIKRANARRHEDKFLRHATGLIHVGANTGQERDYYARHNLDVLWIEPINAVFETLSKNISTYPKQKAINALVTDKEDAEYTFNLSSNAGLSSSILELKGHKDIWPKVNMVSKIKLKSRTLDSIISEDGGNHDALVLGTQGSELLVLKGARNTLERIKFIKSEAADFEIYEGCTTVTELSDFLANLGFELYGKFKFASAKGVGSCYDLIFSRPPV